MSLELFQHNMITVPREDDNAFLQVVGCHTVLVHEKDLVQEFK